MSIVDDLDIGSYDRKSGPFGRARQAIGGVVLEGLLGNRTAERVLLFLEQYGEGYAREIERTFGDVSMSMALGQLRRFEASGLLVSKVRGRTRLFTWNPRYPFLEEVRALLRKALESLSSSDRQRYFSQRRRPRRSGKPS